MSQPPLAPTEVSLASRLCPQPEGGPTVRGSELRVETVLRTLAGVDSVADLLRAYPGLEAADVHACLAYAAATVAGHPPPLVSPVAEVPTLPQAECPIPIPETLVGPGANPALSIEPRARVPGYELLGELGRGGMGVVYKARQVGLNRLVALKMVLAGDHAGPEMLARFRREAEAVARLQHPGIVQIHEIGEHDGNPYFSLELVTGGTLAGKLTRDPWPAAAAAALVESLARAVAVAHAAGIVHRDLKPGNVLLAADGAPKVTDFGLAKRLEDERGQTRTGDILGTPSYMAPEQAAGKTGIGPAADLWALGAILYELLTGRPPFKADTALETVLQVMELEPAPVRVLNPKVPRDLTTVCLKCLEKDPAKRYASAEALADDLRRFLDGEPVVARELSRGQRLGRFLWRRPGAALERASTGMVAVVVMIPAVAGGVAGVAGLLNTGLLTTAAVRARLRPLAWGVAAGAVLAAVVSAVLFAKPASGAFVRDAFQFVGIRAERNDVGTLVAGLPFLTGLIAGAAARERPRHFAAGLALALALPAFNLVNYLSAVAGAAIVVVPFVLLVRLAAWSGGGRLLDAFCGTVAGALFGSVIGMLVGSLAGGLVAGLRGFTPDDPSWMPVFLPVMGAGALVGALGMALYNGYRSAAAGRKADRTVRPSRP